jgi:TolB-like protein/DNA-binding winged helix-turn-helix (wHTH) protein/Tfp pilus assembly protein PilF
LPANGSSVRFGVFELNLGTGEVRKNGTLLCLPPQPFKILALLVNHAGELVTRDEIQEKVWGQGTFVDFEHGLNFAIQKIRAVLRDDADTPRYIETLPRRGYRFIMPVGGVNEVLSPGIDSNDGIDGENALASSPVAPPSSPLAPLSIVPARPWRKIAALGILALLALGSIYGASRTIWRRPKPLGNQVLMVVLPFENLTGQPDNEYICDGLTEEMISQLSVLNPGRLSVIARTSAMHYKGTTKTVGEIGGELGADYVLESSVRKTGNRLRITTQLADTHTQRHLWAGNYDRDFGNILDVDREVALAVAGEMRMQVFPRPQAPLLGIGAIPPEALDFYLRGRHAWDRRTIPDFRTAINFFEQAVAVAPDYAQAYAGMADSFALLGSFGGMPYREAYPKAKEQASKALQLDASLAEAHTSLAFVEGFYDWRFAEAEKEFQRATELNPNYATAHEWYGLLLSMLGRHAEAIAQMQLARQFDPASAGIACDLGTIFRRAGQYERAIEQFTKARELEPNYFESYQGLTTVYAEQHRFAEAEAENEKFRKASGSSYALDALLAFHYAAAGQTDRAERLMAGLRLDLKKRGWRVTPCMSGPAWYAVLGEKQKALTCLEDALEARPDWMVSLKSDHAWDNLRSEPRFQALLHRVGLDATPLASNRLN